MDLKNLEAVAKAMGMKEGQFKVFETQESYEEYGKRLEAEGKIVNKYQK